MTPVQIITTVTSLAVDDSWGASDTKALQRYFVAHYCKWLTQENIGEITHTSASNVCRSIAKIENGSEYRFIVARIKTELNKFLPRREDVKPIYQWLKK